MFMSIRRSSLLHFPFLSFLFRRFSLLYLLFRHFPTTSNNTIRFFPFFQGDNIDIDIFIAYMYLIDSIVLSTITRLIYDKYLDIRR
jgi:hypothetical protein